MLIDLRHQPGEMLGLAMYIQGGAIRPAFDKNKMPGVLLVKSSKDYSK